MFQYQYPALKKINTIAKFLNLAKNKEIDFIFVEYLEIIRRRAVGDIIV